MRLVDSLTVVRRSVIFQRSDENATAPATGCDVKPEAR